MVKVGDVIQVNSSGKEEWQGALLFVDEVKDWGVQAGMVIPARGVAYIRLTHEQYDIVGRLKD